MTTTKSNFLKFCKLQCQCRQLKRTTALSRWSDCYISNHFWEVVSYVGDVSALYLFLLFVLNCPVIVRVARHQNFFTEINTSLSVCPSRKRMSGVLYMAYSSLSCLSRNMLAIVAKGNGYLFLQALSSSVGRVAGGGVSCCVHSGCCMYCFNYLIMFFEWYGESWYGLDLLVH